MKLKIEEKRKEINDTYSIILQPEEPVIWKADNIFLQSSS